MTREIDVRALDGFSAPNPGAGAAAGRPDPEVVAKPQRRQFSAGYRLRVLEEADRCTEPGKVGRLLRWEGLYSPQLSAWRNARRQGALRGLAAKKRGAKPAKRNPLAGKVRELDAKVARPERELRQAHSTARRVPSPAATCTAPAPSGNPHPYVVRPAPTVPCCLR